MVAKSKFALVPQKRAFCTLNEVSESTTSGQVGAIGDDRFKQGWYTYLEPHVEVESVISFSPALEKQFELCKAAPGNRHLKYDLLTLALRALRAPLTDDYYKTSVLLNLGLEVAKEISGAEKFKTQLNTHLEKHLSTLQRLDIRTKIGEHKQKLQRNGWLSVPVMAAYAHFLLLDAQLDLAAQVINKARAINAALLYFKVGVAIEAAANEKMAKHQSGSETSTFGAFPQQPNLESPQSASIKGQTEFDRIISGEKLDVETKTENLESTVQTASTATFEEHKELDSLEEEVRGMFMEAARMYYRSIAQNGQNTESYTNLAILEFYKKIDTGLAQFEVEGEIESKKVRPKGYNAPVRRYKPGSKVLRTVELLEKAVSMDVTKENYLADYHLAFVQETELGEVEKARQNYQKALEKNPDSLHAHAHLGALLQDEKQYEKALKHFEQAKLLSRDPEHTLLSSLNLANCHAKLGSTEAALKEMQRCIRKFPTMPSINHQLGMILVRASRKEESLAAFDRALQLHSLYPKEPFDPSPT